MQVCADLPGWPHANLLLARQQDCEQCKASGDWTTTNCKTSRTACARRADLCHMKTMKPKMKAKTPKARTANPGGARLGVGAAQTVLLRDLLRPVYEFGRLTPRNLIRDLDTALAKLVGSEVFYVRDAQTLYRVSPQFYRACGVPSEEVQARLQATMTAAASEGKTICD